MRITIDPDRCTGHGRCYALAPQLFDADDDGFGIAREALDDADADLLHRAQLAAASCPEDAIAVDAHTPDQSNVNGTDAGPRTKLDGK